MSKPFNLGGSSCLLRKKGAMLYNLTASRKVALKLTRTSHGMFMVSANTQESLICQQLIALFIPRCLAQAIEWAFLEMLEWQRYLTSYSKRSLLIFEYSWIPCKIRKPLWNITVPIDRILSVKNVRAWVLISDVIFPGLFLFSSPRTFGLFKSRDHGTTRPSRCLSPVLSSPGT